MKNIEVVAAIIKHNDKILCVQRGEHKFDYIADKFEFPGGKVEPGETLQEAVIREIKEELDMVIKPESSFLTVKHQYPDFFLTMHSFICSCESPFFQLLEHVDYRWLAPFQLPHLDWAAADIPIIKKLANDE